MGGTYVGNDTNCSGAPCDGGGCPAGEIEDCNGNCFPEDWVGDDECDDGANEWNGVPIYLNCDQFDCDGGDCQPSQCEGGSDSTGACCFESSCYGGYLEIICETSGGVWQGPNSDCSSSPCGDMTYDVCPAGCAFTDIQSALDASSPGAIITVGPGVYSTPASADRMVEMPAHDVQLVAPQGAIIDGGSTHSGVYWATSPPPTTASRLEGFTIRNCSGGDGAGMTLYGDVEVYNCVFQNNFASVVGGGVAIKAGGSPTFVNCSFNNNSAVARGGGIYLQDEGSSLTLEGCQFLNNEATHGGGFGTAGVAEGDSPKPDSLTMVGCTFIGNTAHHGAGGFSAVKVVSMMNCDFIDNVAEGDQSSSSGGGWSTQCPTMSITDSLFTRNHAGIQGGGLYVFNSTSNVTILGTSFNENTAGLAGRGGGIQIDDGVCEVMSGSFCGNQPLDYAGDGITIDPGVCLPVDCTDTDGNGVADACECPTDINGDFVTDSDDLMIIIARFGEFCELYPDCDPDFDGDGWITVSDLLYLLASWGPCGPDG
jgi:predicted outer membrane repeat protein